VRQICSESRLSLKTGSKIEAAKRYGVDLTLTIRRLGLTPTQRAREMEGALHLVEELQRSTYSTKDVQRKTKN
jgi:hypothetical protein